MPKKIDLNAINAVARSQIEQSLERYEGVRQLAGGDYMLCRWTAQMTAVEIYSIWERYSEKRLISALNHRPAYFLHENNIRGVRSISAGLASYLVRGGKRYSDFKSAQDLISAGDRLIGSAANPFRKLTATERDYLDCLSAIRNMVAHGSDAALAAYRKQLAKVYHISSAPGPEEFLHAIDNRQGSPAKGKSRIYAIAETVKKAIGTTT